MQFKKAKTDFLEYLEIEQNRPRNPIANYDHYLAAALDFAGDDITVQQVDAEMIKTAAV